MTKRWLPACLTLALLLGFATSGMAQETSSQKPGLNLTEIRAKLFGQGGQPGLVASAGPFEAEFDQIMLSAQDLPQLLNLVLDLKDLPLRSEVVLRGKVDGVSFKVKRERTSRGNLEAKLEDLRFTGKEQFLTVVSTLLRQGVKGFKLEGVIDSRKVKLKFEEDSLPSQASAEPLKHNE